MKEFDSLGVVLPELDARTKRLLKAFITTAVLCLPRGSRAKFKRTVRDIDGRKQTKLVVGPP